MEPRTSTATPAPAAPARGEAWDSHCEKLRIDLARAVRRICPRWLAAQADDIVQVALMRVLDARRGNEGEALSASYLKRAAYTAMVDEIRRLRRRREVSLEDEPAAESVPAAFPVDPEKMHHAREIGRALLECLARLVESRRHAVTLYLQGHSVPEAGRLLGWGNKKVENLVFRGLANLRECLAAKGHTP